ncbi:hypothetical protein JTY60_00060 [symbiont of Argiope bruennichi]|uniref:hypothetical protein n=1 Tax=symbiont of Argiope bruennichi TaxID=2810479 RepID=UPI003DA1F286
MKKEIYLLSTILIASYVINNIGNNYNYLKSINKASITSKNNTFNTNNSKLKSNDSVYIKRYDGFEGVDSNLIKQDNNDFLINKISQVQDKYNTAPDTVRWDSKEHKVVYSKDKSKYKTKDLLKEIFENQLYLKENQNFLNSGHTNLNQNNNLKNNNNLGLVPHTLNYDGTWTPWWSFGTFYYWYMSKNTIDWVNDHMAWGIGLSTTIFSSFLMSLGISGFFAAILTVWMIFFSYSFYVDVVSNNNLDKSNGVVIKTSWILPVVYDYWPQNLSKKSEINSFSVDYNFCSNDYITVCLDENNLNTLENIWNDLANMDQIIVFLKSLKQYNNTGLFGHILEQDYEDFYNAFLNNDFNSNYDLYSDSNVIHYIKDTLKNNWKSIDIQTRRGGSYYAYWQNT